MYTKIIRRMKSGDDKTIMNRWSPMSIIVPLSGLCTNQSTSGIQILSTQYYLIMYECTQELEVNILCIGPISIPRT